MLIPENMLASLFNLYVSLPTCRCPLYIDPRNELYCQRGSDSSEQYEDSETDHPVSQPVIGKSSSRLSRASHLLVEDDKVSHGSHPSTAFATPNETTPEGVTPNEGTPTSDNEFKKQNGQHGEGREEISSAVAVLADLQNAAISNENGMSEIDIRIDPSLDEQSDPSRSESKSSVNTDHQESQQILIPTMNGGVGHELKRSSSLKFLAKSASVSPQGTDIEAHIEQAKPIANNETEIQELSESQITHNDTQTSIESWELWGEPSQMNEPEPILFEDTPDTVPLNFNPPGYSAATAGLHVSGSPKMISNHCNDVEESFSAGSGCFNKSGSFPHLSGSPYKTASTEIRIESGNGSVPTSGAIHKPVSPDSPLVKARGHRSPTSMSTGTNTSSASDEQLFTKPNANGFPPALESSITQYGAARKKNQPFNLTISSKRQLSPEHYYSPVGGKLVQK